MSIQGQIQELKSIDSELKKIRERGKVLRARKQKLQNEVYTYIKSKNIPGVKFQGEEILIKEKIKYKRNTKQDLEENYKNIFSKYEIRNPETFLEELAQAKKGEYDVVNEIKILKTRKNKN